ncbi:hypothetical protein [Mycoplasma sp. SG1]|uniref:hypothetical protein n=1 Tax=Mycoplasma sp. SG1 TaxID=2810348 RepID=UPI00202480A7|nr:hypothetical protein [Mycoplasma sp. SG1]URM53205.1 hypothetical protein JRW51_02560 [Mycoplasma sp. SG1]
MASFVFSSSFVTVISSFSSSLPHPPKTETVATVAGIIFALLLLIFLNIFFSF